MTDATEAAVLAEVRALLDEMREAMRTPMVSYTIPHHDSPEAQEAARAVAHQLAENAKAGAILSIPAGANEYSIQFPERNKDLILCLDRLCALLSLSPGERAFVTEIADATVAGDVSGADASLGVFADWLEDAERLADGTRFRRMRVQPNDVVVVTMPRHDTPQEIKLCRDKCKAMLENISERHQVQGIAMPHNYTIASLPRDMMRGQGWVHQEEATSLVLAEREECARLVEKGEAAPLRYVTFVAVARTIRARSAPSKGETP